jgi:3-hydroxybutyryl-CoA dehydrogenase
MIFILIITGSRSTLRQMRAPENEFEPSTPAMGVTTVGIVGAGFMGAGIAESAAAAGLQVIAYEPDRGALERAAGRIATSTGRAVERGKLTGDARDELLARIGYETDLDALAETSVVVEAVVEDERVKCDLFARLDAAVPDETVLASNTSSIPIAQLSAATGRPDRVVGLHFFSPVPVMPLVEIVHALDASEDTLATAEGLVRMLGKTPIHTKDRSGFVVNMLLVPYLMSAVRMYEDGFATREDIDEGMRLGCGHPMGPLTLCDFIGLDVLYSVCDSLYDEFKEPSYAPPPLLKRMVVSGRLGRKAGRGFYDYS